MFLNNGLTKFPSVSPFIIKCSNFFNKILKAWSPCFVQPSRGDVSDNFTYIVKEGNTFTEFGTRPKIETKKVKVNLMAKAIDLARQGQLAQLELEMPGLWLRNRRDFERVHLEAVRPLNKLRKGIWLVGSPGTGKSLFAHKYDTNVYHKPPNKWFDGYFDQKVIVVDDIDRSNAESLAYYLKLWCDCYPFLAEIKGSAVYLDHEIVIVTSNYRINTLYSDPDLQAALHRRYKEVVVLGFRETPIGEIEIKTQEGLITKYFNNTNILD